MRPKPLPDIFSLSKPLPHFHSYLNLLLQIFQALEHHFVNVVQQCVGDFWCGLGVSPSEIHWMWTRLKAPGIRYFKIDLVLIFTFFSHYHIPNKYIA